MYIYYNWHCLYNINTQIYIQRRNNASWEAGSKYWLRLHKTNLYKSLIIIRIIIKKKKESGTMQFPEPSLLASLNSSCMRPNLSENPICWMECQGLIFRGERIKESNSKLIVKKQQAISKCRSCCSTERVRCVCVTSLLRILERHVSILNWTHERLFLLFFFH